MHMSPTVMHATWALVLCVCTARLRSSPVSAGNRVLVHPTVASNPPSGARDACPPQAGARTRNCLLQAAGRQAVAMALTFFTDLCAFGSTSTCFANENPASLGKLKVAGSSRLFQKCTTSSSSKPKKNVKSASATAWSRRRRKPMNKHSPPWSLCSRISRSEIKSFCWHSSRFRTKCNSTCTPLRGKSGPSSSGSNVWRKQRRHPSLLLLLRRLPQRISPAPGRENGNDDEILVLMPNSPEVPATVQKTVYFYNSC